MENNKLTHTPFFVSILLIGIALLLHVLFTERLQGPESFVNAINQNINEELSIIQRDNNYLKKVFIEDPQFNFSDIHEKPKYPTFIYKNRNLVYWSDFQFVPEYKYIEGNYSFSFLNLNNGKFVIRRQNIIVKNNYFEIYTLLPVQISLDIDNQYLRSGYNPNIIPHQNIMVDALPSPEFHEIRAYGEHYLFSVQFGEDFRINNEPFQILLLLLVSAGILLMCYYLLRWVKYYASKRKFVNGFFLLLSGLIAIRAGMLIFDFPSNIIQMALFNPRYYASSILSPSLGDFLINTIIFLILIIFAFRYFFHSFLYRKLLGLKYPQRVSVSVAALLISYFALFLHYYFIKTIYLHSQWTLDITQTIDLNILKIVCFIIFVLISVIYFLVAHISFNIFSRLNTTFASWITLFVISSLCIVTLAHLVDVDFLIISLVNVAYFLLLYFLQLPKKLIHIKFITFIYFFISAMVSAFVAAYSVYNFEKVRNINDKYRFASHLIIENDIWGEYLLAEATQKIKNDPFINNRLFSPFASKDVIEQKIRRIYLNNYFDKYDVQIYIFNSMGEPYDYYQAGADYFSIKRYYEREFRPTEHEGLYFDHQIGASLMKRYVNFIEIKRYGINIGYIVMDLKLKRIIPSSVYPQLLVDQRFLYPYLNRNYSYGILSHGELVYNFGNFNYIKDFNPNDLNRKMLYTEGIIRDGYHHFALMDENEKNIIVTSYINPVHTIISNFSFFFLILIFTILFLLITYTIFHSFKSVQLNFATKIQLYMNFAFFLPLLVVSIVTLSVISSTYRREVNRQYIRKAESISNNIVTSLDNYLKNVWGKDGLYTDLAQMARFTENDINLYSVNGKLLATSQPRIFEKDLLSEFINPVAISEIKEGFNTSIIVNENISHLSYKAAYIGVKSFETGELIGILSIPFFESQYELDRQVIEVMTNIINIFSFLFILFLIISYFASKILTHPLRYITQKIRRTTLDHHEPIEWNSDDEIGLMVGEYNRMLEKLEASKEALAISEKESAWREMAKQVAHEIKNPLTPMKLTLQLLQKKLQDQKAENAEVFEKPIHTLLHQIDTLNDIATSFSAFAQMPIPKNERFEISSLMRKTINLFSSDERGSIHAHIPEGEFYVIGDPQLMNRILSNLIINGFQSVPKERKPFIEVFLRVSEKKVLIEVKDNGMGIPENIRDKIFVPNFSTKYSGSGIGLAIAKRGVEHAGGKIWFETEEDVGTSFLIELPIVN